MQKMHFMPIPFALGNEKMQSVGFKFLTFFTVKNRRIVMLSIKRERERDKESQKRIFLERPFNVNNSPIVTQDAVDLASTLFCPNGTEPL